MPIPSCSSDVRDDRDDLSPLLLHMTRDDLEYDNGMTARKNFENILEHQRIIALHPHCMHQKHLPTGIADKFNVACFSETPISQIKKLTGEIEGRRIKLKPYGFAFKREFLIELGAKPVSYIPSYGGDMSMRQPFEDIFNKARRTKLWREALGILPFISAMHEKCDWQWEREWRVRGDVEFTLDDLEFVILPEGREIDLHQKLKRQGIMIVCPEWGPDKMVMRLAGQFRRMRLRLEAMAEA